MISHYIILATDNDEQFIIILRQTIQTTQTNKQTNKYKISK